jgi:hypothetical protein
MIINKIHRWVKRLTSRFPDNPMVTVLRNVLLTQPAERSPSREGTIAVQCLENPFYFGLLGAVAQNLRATTGAAGELVVVRSISGAVGVRWWNRLARSSLIGSIIAAQWIRAFAGIVDRVAYRSISLAHPITDVFDWFRSRAVWRRAQGADDFSKLRVLGVPVGDLIIDSYLRFRPSARLDRRDPFLRRVIWQAHRDVRRARAYFHARKPSLYVTSFSTYVEHGIAVRVALQEGVRVQSFGSFVQPCKELTLSDWFHTPDTMGYRSTFRSLDRQDERLAQAEQQLRARLSGGIDTATSYMNVSAYAHGSEPLPDVAGAVVVFLHDFYDSPHAYDGLVFHDFWDWTCFTIEALRETKQKFFLKPHPNQISQSGEVLKELVATYPGLPLLSARITNVQLAEADILCGVTVYGTVAHELAYLGVPTIACAKHPHYLFEFCRTAQTVEQYRQYLQAPHDIPLAKSEMRRQALEFYYMHNLYGDQGTLALRNSYAAFFKACHAAERDDTLLIQRFQDLRRCLQIARAGVGE